MWSVVLAMPVVGYLAYVAVPGSSLFSWHPICMSLSFAGLMLAGVEIFSLGGRPRGRRLALHWQVQAAAVALTLAGMAAIYLNKELRGAAHFTSTHGQLGLATVAAAVAQAAGGVLTLYAARLPPLLPPRFTKTLHALSGVVLAALGLFMVQLGLATAWFQHVSAPSVRPLGQLLLALSTLSIVYRVVKSRRVVKMA